MQPIGLALFYLLLGLARIANFLHMGPRWIREFKIDRHTLY